MIKIYDGIEKIGVKLEITDLLGAIDVFRRQDWTRIFTIR